jgi:predicted membrane channel-forming protein YqfA (hemolysin III family)
MSYFEIEKKFQKKLAQVTVFQVILVLSLPSYAQIIKKVEPSMILTWIGFSCIVATIIGAYFYKQSLRRNFVRIQTQNKIRHLDSENHKSA